MLFLEYPTCSTCKNAKKFLENQGVDFEDRNIKENNPNAEELTEWITKSGLEIKRFFNTSGLVYKALELKDKLPNMSFEEKVNILATDGMLIKRPLLIGEDFILVGFKEDIWQKMLNVEK